MQDELVYRQRALEHRAQDPGAEPEPLELPVAWSRWAWPAVISILVLAGALGLVLSGGS